MTIRTRIRVVAVVAAAVTGLVSTAASDAAAATIGSVTRGSYVTDRVTWKPCGQALPGFDCGTLRVPISYGAPDTRTRKVALIRRPADEPSSRVGTLVINPGGPGTSGVSFLPDATALLFPSLTRRFDLVSFDPRGVGASGHSRCRSDAAEDRAQTREIGRPSVGDLPALRHSAQRFAGDCEDAAHLRTDVSTVTAAHDMETLRRSLGETKLNFLGFSYGTFLGATYARLFPSRVGAMVLDGGIDPKLTTKSPLQRATQQARGFEDGLDRFLTWCTGHHSSCGFTGGRAGYRKLANAIKKKPILARQGDTSRPVNDATLLNATRISLYTRQGWPFLAQMLTQAQRGDGTLVQQAADTFVGRSSGGKYSPTKDAITLINAADRAYPRDARAFRNEGEHAAEVAPTFGRAAVYEALGTAAVHERIQPSAVPNDFRFRSKSLPILVIGTTHDVATPYAGAISLTKQLGHARLLTMSGDGHTAIGRGSTCIDSTVQDYLENGTVPSTGATCEQSTAAPSSSVRRLPRTTNLVR